MEQKGDMDAATAQDTMSTRDTSRDTPCRESTCSVETINGTGTTLSHRAKAFSIDSLLSQCEKSRNLNKNTDIEMDDELIDVDDGSSNGSPSPLKLPRESSVEAEEISSHSADEVTAVEETCITSSSLEKSKCTLEMTDLWKKFYELGTEMIITKSGRRMFPSLRVSFSDLEPKAHYQVYFDIAPVDNKRYRYAYHRSSWLVAGRADPPIPRRCYTHPDGPFRGDCLQKQSISFEKVKLTNNLHDKWGYIILNSMHKYQPRIHLVKYEEKLPTVTTIADLQSLDRKMFVFPETQFIGVTAYQNQLITKLKIDSNPFAKGFRDSARITQIDRESVDLLIKASRHGYNPPSTLPHHPMLGGMPLVPPISSYQAGIMGKFPHMLSMPFQGLVGQLGISKDIFKVYFDQISGGSQSAPSSRKADDKQTTIRFSPYHR